MDKNTYEIDRQFLVGPSLLVTPVLEERIDEVTGYFPYDHWYDWYTGELVQEADPDPNQVNETGMNHKLYAPIDHIPLHVRGGAILPTQEIANTTEYARLKPFGLIVAPDEYGEANGDLFFDDGLSQDLDANYLYSTFTLRNDMLKMNVEHNSYVEQVSQMKLNKVKLFTDYWKGKRLDKLKFYLNEMLIDEDEIEIERHFLIVNIDVPMSQSFKLEWSFDEEKYPHTNQLATLGDQLIAPIIECSLQNNSITKEDCEKRKCLFNDAHINTPKCYLPKNVGGYVVQNETADEYVLKKADSFTYIDEEIETVKLEIVHGKVSGEMNRVTRLKITDPAQKRYEVPVKLNFEETDEKFLDFSIVNNPRRRESLRDGKLFSFEVKNPNGTKM